MDRWFLVFPGMKDCPRLRAMMKHLETYPLWKDSGARICTYEDYLVLISTGKIVHQSYWCIEEGQVGVVAREPYQRYSDTWNNIRTAKEDFCAGWNRAAEHYKIEED